MTSPLTEVAPVNEVANTFSRLFATLRASMVQQLSAMWFDLGSYRDQDIDRWLNLSIPMVEAATETSASATSTYLQMQLDIMGSDSDTYIPDLSPIITRPGVSNEEVYTRPFKDVWTALSKGKEYVDALDDGADRLRQLIETDIQLAHTRTSRDILSKNSDVVGFRRVPTGAYSCALCLIAATQRYRKFDLMPIHPGCDCRVAPIISESRVPQVLDSEKLEEIHNAIQRQFGLSDRAARKIDYRKILLQEEHGEYGPVLVVAKHNFTGPDDLKK